MKHSNNAPHIPPNKISTINNTEDNRASKLHYIHLSTSNVRTLRTDEKILKLQDAFKDSNLNIFGISLVRRSGAAREL